MKLSDCSFLVGPQNNRKVFKAHKIMLSMASPVFEFMFYGSLAEKQYPIAIPDVEIEAFETLLVYIYTDCIKVEIFEKATALCYVAQKYMLPHVVEHCINYVTSNLKAKNACRAFEFAKMFEKPNLMQSSMEIIMKNTMEVLADPGFVDIQVSTLMEILNKDALNIASELELFNALELYATARGCRSTASEDSDSDSSWLRKAVQEIRFLLMTPKQFAEGPASSNLLHHHEKYSILMNISSANVKECPLPQGFSTSRSIRKWPINLRTGQRPQHSLRTGYC